MNRLDVARAEYRAALERRERLIDVAGLARCRWLALNTDFDLAPNARARLRMLEQAQAHVAGCPICQARDEYAKTHLGPPPARPLSPWDRFVAAIGALPSWLQPAALGAIGVAAIVAARVLLASLGSNRISLRIALGAIAVGALGGAAGGLTFSATRPLLAKLGALGDYLTGIVIMASYMGSILVMFMVLPGKPLIEKPAEAIPFVAVTVVFGLVGAYWWRRQYRARS